MHSGEEGIAPRRAALLGIVVGKLRAFLPDAVDVRRFPDHQALMIDARLHPADVVAHDEEDVGLCLLLLLLLRLLLLRLLLLRRPRRRLRLLPLLRGRRHARRETGGDECKQSEPWLSHDFHENSPYLSASWGKR